MAPRRFILVLVLEFGERSVGVLEFRALSELHPATAGLGLLSGRVLGASYPGLKPWAMIFNRFAVIPTSKPIPTTKRRMFVGEQNRNQDLSLTAQLNATLVDGLRRIVRSE